MYLNFKLFSPHLIEGSHKRINKSCLSTKPQKSSLSWFDRCYVSKTTKKKKYLVLSGKCLLELHVNCANIPVHTFHSSVTDESLEASKAKAPNH